MILLNQDKGLTIIEVVASVAVLAIIVLVIVAVLQNTAATSASSTGTDRSLQHARSVMEEIKNRLDTSETVYDYENKGLMIDLASIGNGTLATYTQTIYYPSNSNRQYSITITSKRPTQSVDPITGTSPAYSLSAMFRDITVACTDLRTSRTPVTLQAMVAY